MTSYKPISKEEHKKFMFSNPQNWSFAKEQNNCPICLAEVRYILQSTVIIFLKDNPLKEKTSHFKLYAIQGLANKQNLYINKKGQWITKYIPAFYRSQPFKFIYNAEKKDLILCYDDEMNLLSDKIKTDEFFPIFDKKGNPSPEFQQKISLTKGYYENLKTTDEAVTLLTDLNLIEEWPITLKYLDEEKKEKEKGIE